MHSIIADVSALASGQNPQIILFSKVKSTIFFGRILSGSLVGKSQVFLEVFLVELRTTLANCSDNSLDCLVKTEQVLVPTSE